MLLFSLCLTLLNTKLGQIVSIGESHGIHSTQLNEDREYKVYLPDTCKWAQDRRYPVPYVLDGDSHFLHTAASVEFLSAQGDIPEMIVVAVASKVRVRDFSQTDWPSHWVGGGGADKFRAFLSKELIPEIDRTYRTRSAWLFFGPANRDRESAQALDSAAPLQREVVHNLLVLFCGRIGSFRKRRGWHTC